ncbi:hypothetical protein [Acuticoccus mangrovi]|uniref:DUF732 domain-containing protein n=1 Tax=Acuticoccus mangrovi TaxID=2796142 RepID=A0A934IS42_9HYPH|nr:hypothetical protein [Acuticoccus mangrovi]MBJ3777217.1 hypothetical protein [Acuticoccus mangrovi]
MNRFVLISLAGVIASVPAVADDFVSIVETARRFCATPAATQPGELTSVSKAWIDVAPRILDREPVAADDERGFLKDVASAQRQNVDPCAALETMLDNSAPADAFAGKDVTKLDGALTALKNEGSISGVTPREDVLARLLVAQSLANMRNQWCAWPFCGEDAEIVARIAPPPLGD